MNVNLSETGLKIFFKPWQVPIIEKLLFEATDENKALKTSELTYYINNLFAEEDKDKPENEKRKISRASVIIMLQSLAKEGLLNVRKEPGKGGYHALYWRAKTLHQFLKDANVLFTEKSLDIMEEYDLKG